MTPTENIAIAAYTGARVLAAIIGAGFIELSPALEAEDFVDYRQRIALGVIRSLQATHTPITVTNIGEAIELRDMARDTNTANTSGWVYLGSLLVDQPKYPSMGLFMTDLHFLRRLARDRAAMAKAT